ncbi:MAG: hypothetical protein ACL7BU_16235 [Candidatus Phlomobacter fragariae]
MTNLIKLDELGTEGVVIGLYDPPGNLLDIKKQYEPNTAFDNKNSFIIKLEAAYVANR